MTVIATARVDQDVDAHRRRLERDQAEDRDDLQAGLRLSQPARRDHDATLGGDRAKARDRELAGDDHHRDPRRKPVERDERDQGGSHQQLVGQRVHQLAESRLLALAPGDVAVEPVGQRGDRKQRRRDHVALLRLVQERHHDHRDHQDPQDREDVRRVERESGNTPREPSPCLSRARGGKLLCPCECGVQHLHRQLAREGVLLARVVRAEQRVGPTRASAMCPNFGFGRGVSCPPARSARSAPSHANEPRHTITRTL